MKTDCNSLNNTIRSSRGGSKSKCRYMPVKVSPERQTFTGPTVPHVPLMQTMTKPERKDSADGPCEPRVKRKLRHSKKRKESIETQMLESEKKEERDTLVVRNDTFEVFLQKYHKNIKFVDNNG